MDEKQLDNILVIIVARIGDTLLSTPVIRALREGYPSARITVLAHPKRLEVLQHLPEIDVLHPITKHRAWLYGRLPQKKYDLCLLYSKDTALLNFALRVSRTIRMFGAADSVSPGKLQIVPPPTEPLHAVDERLMLLPEGLKVSSYRLGYHVTKQEKDWASDWIQRQFEGRPRILVGIQAMSFPTKSYRDWPLEHFATLMDRLAEHFEGIRYVLLGDKACREKISGLLNRPDTCNSCGKLSLRQSAALMNALDLYIGVDTGPTHIAGALEVPMAAIYHCQHPGALLKPLNRDHLQVIEHLRYVGDCQRSSPLSLVPVEEVYQACLRLLGDSQPMKAAQR
jgi:heptosyltransferase III